MDIEELNRRLDGVDRKMTLNYKPYHRQENEGFTLESLLYWREYGDYVHLWLGDGVVNTLANEPMFHNRKEDIRKQIEAEFYPKGALQLPNSVYRQRREQRRHDRKMFRLRELHRREASRKHPIIYGAVRVVPHPFANWLLKHWVDWKIKKEDSSE